MSVLRQVNDRLASLEARLADRPEEAGEVRAIRRLLEEDDRHWIGTVEARRLLGVRSVNTVKVWVRLGLLRGRHGPNGRLKVHLDDVLHQRRVYAIQDTFGDNAEVTEEERQPLTPEARAIVDGILARMEEQAPVRDQVGGG